MADRAVNIKLRVQDAEKAIADLKALGKEGEKALERVRKGVGPTPAALKATNKNVKQLQEGFKDMAGTLAVIQGPLGPIAGRFSALGAAMSRIGVAGGIAIGVMAGVAVGFKKASDAAIDAERQMLRIEGVIQATGGAAGISAGQIDRMADRIGRATLQSRQGVRDAAASLLLSTSIQRRDFERVLSLASDLSEVMRTDLRSEVLKLGKALEDPERGLTRLERASRFFTAAQRDQIKELAEVGRVAEAQELILGTLEARLDGIAEKAARGAAGQKDTLGESITGLLETTGNTALIGNTSLGLSIMIDGLTALLGGDLDLKAKNLRVELALLQQTAANQSLAGSVLDFTRIDGGGLEQEIAVAKQELAALDAQIAVRDKREIAEGDANASVAREQRLADKIFDINKDLDSKFLGLSKNRVAKIEADGAKAIANLRALQTQTTDPAKSSQLDAAIARQGQFTAAQITQATEADRRRAESALEQAERLFAANDKLIDQAKFQNEQLGRTERQRFVEARVNRIQTTAIEEQVEARKLSEGANFDEAAARAEATERIDDQTKALRLQSGALFDNTAATKNAEAAQKAFKRVSETIAFETAQLALNSREQFVNTRIRQLGEHATQAQIRATRQNAAVLFDETERMGELADAASQAAGLITGSLRDLSNSAFDARDALLELFQAGFNVTFVNPFEKFLEETFNESEVFAALTGTSKELAAKDEGPEKGGGSVLPGLEDGAKAAGTALDLLSGKAVSSAATTAAKIAIDQTATQSTLSLASTSFIAATSMEFLASTAFQAAVALATVGAGGGEGGGGGGTFGKILKTGAKLYGNAQTAHTGGTAGGAGPRRSVPMDLFTNVPRFGRGTMPGLNANEIPAILHRGEEVLNPDQSRAFRNAANSPRGGDININSPLVVVHGGNSRDIKQSAAQAGAELRRTIEDAKRNM